MVIKVGVNGFGRIGRIVSRACLQNSGLQLSAINDPAISVEYVDYLMKFDSTHGKLQGIITHNDKEIIINGNHIKVFHEKCPSCIPWQTADVQYVVEASGMFASYEKASGHLISTGVKRVLVTSPSIDIPMLVLGVNDHDISPDRRVISCASSTLYCLAPIIKVLEDTFGVEEGFITSIHAMTPSLKPLDGLCLRGKHWRDHRSIHQNIIPASTGACKALGKILPGTKDKLSGIAFRVPIVNVSVLDLTVRLQINTKLQEIAKSVQQASKSTLKNIIKVSNEENVSSDFIGEVHSCVFDEASSLQLKPNFFKIICWYENEYSYACRVVDTIFFSENQYMLEISRGVTLRPVMSSKMLQTNIPLKRYSKNDVLSENSHISQETIELRTPISSVVRKSTTALPVSTDKDRWSKNDSLMKIWNSRCEMMPCGKPIRCSFFQSCAGITQTMKKVECNNKERLENVRREFTKMVSITEDLLRKTKSNQGVRPKSIDESKVISGYKQTKEKDSKNHTITTGNDKSIEEFVDKQCSGDTIPLENDKLNKESTVLLATSLDELSESSDISKSVIKNTKKMIDISEAINKLKGCDEHHDESLTDIEIEEIDDKFAIPDRNVNKKIRITKSNIAIKDTIQQEKEFECVWHGPHPSKSIDLEKEKHVTFDNAAIQFGSNNKHLPKQKENNDVSEDNSMEVKIVSSRCDITEKPNIELMDEALKKRNILLVTETCVGDDDSEQCDNEIDDSPAETDDKLEEDKASDVETVIDQFPVGTVSEKTSKCTTPENTVTSVSNDVAHDETQDIYDKLDSTSGSDSNNSFEIKERKSQVIQLTDLTNSLEDLTRLNNICRIIEISDELSDKLFSALDNGEESDLKQKRWSFKDLCAKIKLDEFCNKVFGGSAVSHE